jgi:hypothetical protein
MTYVGRSPSPIPTVFGGICNKVARFRTIGRDGKTEFGSLPIHASVLFALDLFSLVYLYTNHAVVLLRCNTSRKDYRDQAFPSENCTTAHLPLKAHSLAPVSPPPPGSARNSSSLPLGSPTTTSPLHVRKARTLTPELFFPSGPMASVNGVVGSQFA